MFAIMTYPVYRFVFKTQLVSSLCREQVGKVPILPTLHASNKNLFNPSQRISTQFTNKYHPLDKHAQMDLCLGCGAANHQEQITAVSFENQDLRPLFFFLLGAHLILYFLPGQEHSLLCFEVTQRRQQRTKGKEMSRMRNLEGNTETVPVQRRPVPPSSLLLSHSK